MADTSGYSRDTYLELAIAKGVNYPRETITRSKPSLKQVLLGLASQKVTNPAEVLDEVRRLKRGVRLVLLQERARELHLDLDGISEDAFKVAIHIYAANPKELEDLQRFNSKEHIRSTFGYLALEQVSENRFSEAVANGRKFIEGQLRDPKLGSIGTIEKVEISSDYVRIHINIDKKQHMSERPEDPRFPGRKGPHDDFPLHKIVASFEKKTNSLRVSAFEGYADKVVQGISEALFGAPDYFVKEEPDPATVQTIFTDETLRHELASFGRVTELELTDLALEGAPSRLLLQGDDLIATIDALAKKDVLLLGENLSRVKKIVFTMNNKSVALFYDKGKMREVGDFGEQELSHLRQFFARWKIFRTITSE